MIDFRRMIVSLAVGLILSGAAGCKDEGNSGGEEATAPASGGAAATKEASGADSGPAGAKQAEIEQEESALGEGTDKQRELMARAKTAFLSEQMQRAEVLFSELAKTEPHPPDEEVKSIIRDVDTDGNGSVEFLEYCNLVKMIDLGEQTEDELKDAFMLWSEGRKVISTAEMHKAMTTLGDKLSEDEFKEFMKDADSDANGNIDYEEYKRALSWGR